MIFHWRKRPVSIIAFVVWSLWCFATAQGQISFVSSDIALRADASPDDVAGTVSMRDGDVDVSTFMERINADANTLGSSASSVASGEFDVNTRSIDAFGEASAHAILIGGSLADSLGEVDLEIVFTVASPVDYTAELFVDTQFGDSSVRLSPSSGFDVFFHEVSNTESFEDTLMGRLAPGTYTFRAFSRAEASVSDFNMEASARSVFDVDLDFRVPSMPPIVMFRCEPSPSSFCPEQIIPLTLHVHGIVPGPADEPIPFWTEGFDVEIILGKLFEFENGPAPADVVVITTPFDGPEDMYPDELYELGTRVQMALAFSVGSLTGNETVEELPLAEYLDGFAELIDPAGNVLTGSRLELVPEPATLSMLALGFPLVLRRNRAKKKATASHN